jgi:hypothetical protein
MPVVAALVSALVVTFLVTGLTLAQVEEQWNITVVIETLLVARLTLIVALAHVFILGLPLFLFLRSRMQVGLGTCAIGGFLVGAIPFGAMTLLAMFGLQSALTGGKATVVDGIPTLAGWIEWLWNSGSVGLFGIAGGLAFWLAMRRFETFSARNAQELSGGRQTGTWSLFAVAGLVTAVLLSLSSVVKDNSCHNLFRDGRTSIGPQVDASIEIAAADWSILRRIFVELEVRHALSFRSDNKTEGGHIVWRDLNACNDEVNVDALDQPWLAEAGAPSPERGIKISVYALRKGSGWNPVARDLLDRINSAWPRRLIFDDAERKHISMEQALQGRKN